VIIGAFIHPKYLYIFPFVTIFTILMTQACILAQLSAFQVSRRDGFGIENAHKKYKNLTQHDATFSNF